MNAHVKPSGAMMSISFSPEEFASYAAVARAMRSLEDDVQHVMRMAWLAATGLDDPLNVQNPEDLNRETRRLTLTRHEIDNQEWAATQVLVFAQRLQEKYEAAFRGEMLP